MKMTPENMDEMDCRPLLEAEMDINRVPEHMRDRVAAQRAAARAAAAFQLHEQQK